MESSLRQVVATVAGGVIIAAISSFIGVKVMVNVIATDVAENSQQIALWSAQAKANYEALREMQLQQRLADEKRVALEREVERVRQLDVDRRLVLAEERIAELQKLLHR